MISHITCSGGGPIIALPSEIAADWRGTFPPLGIEVPEGWRWGSTKPYIECDYDRACDQYTDPQRFGYDHFGMLNVSTHKALIFTMEQVISFVRNEQGGIIIGNYREYDSINNDIAAVQAQDWNLYSHNIELKEGKLFIFDSAFEGYANPEAIRAFENVVLAEMEPGTYSIYHHNTNDNVGMLKLVKI